MRGYLYAVLLAVDVAGASTASALNVTGAYENTNSLEPLSLSSEFGLSVSILGDQAAVVAPDISVSHYRSDGSGAWSDDANFADPQPKNDFGSYLACNSISVGVDRMVMGVPSGNSVHVFEKQASVWNDVQVLTDGTGGSLDAYGCGVGISGDYIVVGAPGVGAGGRGYVYVRTGTGWVLQGTLVPTGASAGANVGLTVAIDGDTVVLGAPHDNGDHGAAYVFKQTGMTWSQRKLVASDGATGDQFGATVAISKGTVVVGAPNHAATRGAAYVYAGSTMEVELTAKVPAVLGYFGSSVAIDGNRLIVGEMGNSAAYAYSRFGSEWKLRGAFDDAASTRFGGSVAISGDRAIVGAMDDTTTGDDTITGVAYVFKDDTIFADGTEQ